jgi:hypothetical protein
MPVPVQARRSRAVFIEGQILFFLKFFALQPRREIRTDDQHRREELGDECLPRRVNREPHARPRGDFVRQPVDLRRADPIGLLHLVCLFADHDEQHETEHDAGGNEHFAIGQFFVRDERQHRDNAGEKYAEQRPLQNRPAAELQIIRLQKKNNLKAFAVKRGEAEQHQTPHQFAFGNFRFVRTFEQVFLVAVVHGDPAAPVDLVEKPVHHHEQNHDCKQSRRGLQIQGGNVCLQIADDADGHEPGDQCADARTGRAKDDRAALHRAFTAHARNDGGQNENGFESFTKDQNAYVQDRGRRARVRGGGIRVAPGGQTLPE